MCNMIDSNRPPFKAGWFILALMLLSSCGAFRYIPENPAYTKQDSIRDANAHDVDIREFFNH
jgi:hypothetical protein